MSISTSLKLPAELKAQIDETARKAGTTAHAYMVKALTDTAPRAQQFQQDSLDALAEVERIGLAHTLDDVEHYFEQQTLWRKGQAAEPAKPPLKPWRVRANAGAITSA